MADLRAGGLHTSPVAAAALAGVIAGIPTGIVLQLGTDVMPLLGALAGTESVLVGWLFHLVLSGVFGAMFGWMVKWPVFRTLTDTTGATVALGIFHGVVWFAYIVIGVVVPGIVRLLGYDPVTGILSLVPGAAEGSLLSAGAFAFAYLLWGALLGLAYAALEAESAEPEPRGPEPQ